MLSFSLNHQVKFVTSALLVTFIYFNIGCSYAFSSTLLPILRESTTSLKVNDEQASWIASIPYLVCPIGLLIVGVLTDKIGRRKALQVAYVPIIFGWLILANANSITAVIIGRTIIGTTMGCVTYGALYLVEICPTKVRSFYLSVAGILVGVGMMAQTAFALFFHWHTVSGMLFASSAVVCVSLFFLPEPPLWLRAHGRDAEAERAEKWFGVEPAAKDTTGDRNDDERKSMWSTYLHPTVWKPTMIMVAFFVCQQGSGVYVLLFYSVDILRECRVQGDGPTVTVFLCVVRVVGSVTFTMLHNVKRKTLAIISSAGMAASLLVIVGCLKLYRGVEIPIYGNVALIIAFILCVFFALFALLQLPWMLSSEVFPMAVKGKMCAVVNIVGYELMFFVSKMYPKMVSSFGIENVLLIYTGFCVLSILFGVFIMPETKGKTLNEISNSFESRKKPVISNT